MSPRKTEPTPASEALNSSPDDRAVTDGTGAVAPQSEAAPAAGTASPEATLGRAPRQTLAGRVWVAMVCAAVLLVLIIIFIAENSRRVTVSFLGANGHISEALALLIAVVVGIVITLLVGSARIVQLSRQVRRERRALRRSLHS